jgi:mxaL protein
MRKQLSRYLSPDRQGRTLLIAILLLGLCLTEPHARLPQRVFEWFIVLDITQSMNVRDYVQASSSGERSISRLEVSKSAIRQTLRQLPCGSRVALGLFTERDALNITRPLEVCAHFSALDQTVARMDWRMAWAADSFIGHGLYSAIEQAPRLDKNMRVAFLTDGHQAPPVDPRYMPAFAGKTGAVKGYVVGVGKKELSPIPKLDAQDNISAYWDEEEVMRYGTFGMAEVLSVQAMEGQRDRNAAHGASPSALSNAHLSGLDESNLQRLAKTTGLVYRPMEHRGQLARMLTESSVGIWRTADTDLRPWLAVPALLALLTFFTPIKIHRSFNQYLNRKRST